MGTAVGAFCTAMVLCGALTVLVRNCAIRRGVLDQSASSRKAHDRPVPRLGGVAIVAAFLAVLAGAVVWNHGVAAGAETRLLAGLVIGGLLIAALGLYDDLRGADARTKFAVQFVAAATAWALGYRFDIVSLPLLGTLDLGPFGFPLTLLWIVGIVNALNLVDGLDGLAAGVSLVVLASFFAVALGRGDPLLMLFTGALGGAVMGFLFHNAHPASIFMGDTGSMFIGFVLAVLAIPTARTSSSGVALLLPIIALAYPIGDTLLAMLRRAARGMPLFSADRGHVHHRLIAHGFTHGSATLTLCGASACLCWLAIAVSRASELQALLALGLLACALVAALRWLGFLDLAKLDEVRKARRCNTERRRRMSEIAAHLQQAADTEAICSSLAEVRPALEVDHVALKALGHSWTFTPAGKPELRVVRVGLLRDGTGEDVLEIGWMGDGPSLDRDKEVRDREIAMERLCPHVLAALRRVSEPGAGSEPNDLHRVGATASPP